MVSLTGSWVQTAAITWLAYDLTKQSTWAGLILAVQFLPTFLLGPWGGTLADRWPKRSLIFATQSVLLLLAMLLAGMVLTGQISQWHLLAVSIASGIVNAVDFPARLSFVVDLVGRDDLLNAVGLNSVMFNLARVIGPALGAFAMQQLSDAFPEHPRAGPGLCFLVNGLSFVAVLAALWSMTVSGSPSAVDRVEKPSLWAGFRYLASRPGLQLLLVLTGAVSFFAWPILALLPAISDQLLELGQDGAGYGALLSSFGLGALLAALLVASFGTLARRKRFLGAGVGLTVLALFSLRLVDKNLAQAVGCCTLLGCGLIFFNATSQAVTQLSATDANRGRVMGVWTMVVGGAQPLGNLLAGLAADRWGVPTVLLVQGLGVAGAAAVVLGLSLTARARE
jgi:MFS family permease